MAEGPVPTFDELIKHFGVEDRPSKKEVRFSNPDMTYLVHKMGFDHRFIGRMIRRFGEGVVLEGLRRSSEAEVRAEHTFIGICTRIQAE